MQNDKRPCFEQILTGLVAIANNCNELKKNANVLPIFEDPNHFMEPSAINRATIRKNKLSSIDTTDDRYTISTNSPTTESTFFSSTTNDTTLSTLNTRLTHQKKCSHDFFLLSKDVFEQPELNLLNSDFNFEAKN